MIVFNWPDKCPECGDMKLSISTAEAHSSIITVKAQSKTVLPSGEVICECTNRYCGHTWKLRLATTDPVIYAHEDQVMAMADPGITEEDGRGILAIPPSWKSYRLSDILSRCAHRIVQIASQANIKARERSCEFDA